MGHVDVVSFVRDNEVSNIPNCDVIFSKRILDSHSRIEGIRSVICATIEPENPYSYYQLDKKKETIIDSFVKRKNYDIVVCRYIDSAIKCGLLKYREKLVIDADDNLESVLKYQATQAAFTTKWKKQYKSRIIKHMLNKTLSDIMCSFCSNRSELPSPKTIFLHNTSLLNSPVTWSFNKNRLLFVGSLYFYPNKHGLTHFVDYIFPIIKRKNPSAELRVVGECKSDFMHYLNSKDGIEAVGRVDDLVSEYQKAHIVVIPIYYGSGSSVKFVEALLMNRPVVSSPVGARGFSEICQDGVHYMLANDDEEFANKTIELLASASKSKEIAENGYKIANRHFSQERFMEIVKESILNVKDNLNK